MMSAALRYAMTRLGSCRSAVLVVGDLPQRDYRIHGSSVPRLPQLPTTNPASSTRTADLARDQQGHPDLDSTHRILELVDGVAAQTVADVADDRADEKDHHHHRRGEIDPRRPGAECDEHRDQQCRNE